MGKLNLTLNNQMSDAKPSLFMNVSLAGSAAVFTVMFIHPIDVVKTRL